MEEKYYTLTGYKIKNNLLITETMEDYIEMIYRNTIIDEDISVKEIATFLNVKPSSVSKMINKLKKIDIVNSKKYGHVSLTVKGKKLGKFYLNRHNTLTAFLKILNKDKFNLEQVEKIEHFVDKTTIKNIENFIKKDNNF